MHKRLGFAIVGMGLGGLVGVLVAFVTGGGSWAILACGAAGAAIPLLMGPPGK